MMQFIAPLVHAHAGQQSPYLGLHIPGLEAFAGSGNPLASESAVCHASSEDVIFSVHNGINPKRLKIDADSQPSLYFPLLPVVIKSVNTAVDYRFIAHSPQFLSHFPTLPLSPRAPPIS